MHKLLSLGLAAAFLLATRPVLAHGGHGVPEGPHWHATDTLGLLLVVVLAVAGAWFFRGRN